MTPFLTIELIYLAASSVAIIAMAPQVKQLFVTKRSDEFSLASWLAWTCSQGVAILYGLSLGALPYVIINSIWFSYYLVMVAMIMYYRRARPVLSLENAEDIEPLS